LYASEGFREPAVDHKPERQYRRADAAVLPRIGFEPFGGLVCHKYSRMKDAVARRISLYDMVGRRAVAYKTRSGCPLIGAALTAQLPPYSATQGIKHVG